MEKDTKSRLLIVEDDVGSLNVLLEFLESSGYTSYVATDGESAIQKAASVIPDLILLDIMMPVMDGYETCLRLKSIEALKDIPVIFISALSETVNKVKGFQAGGIDYITKPYHYEEVISRINTHITNHRLQLKLKKSEQRFKSLTENSPDIIMRLDENFRFLFVNRQMELITRFKAEEFHGKTIEEMGMPADLCKAWNEAMKNAARLKHIQKFEFAIDLKDETKTFITDVVPEISDNGFVETYLCISRDVTEEKKNRQELESTRDYLNKLLNYASAPIVVWNTEFQITMFNRAFEHLTGFGAEEIIGKSLLMIFPEENKAEYLIKINSTLDGEYWDGVEVPVQCKNGSIRIILWNSANIFEEDGKALKAVIAQGQDITERKIREKELFKLNRALKALGRSNRAMTYVNDESSYLEEVCKIIREDCGYSMVWIGYAEDDETKSVKPAAFSGFEEGYLDKLSITWADVPNGRGPTGTAIRTGEITTCNDMLIDPKFLPWREEAVKRGYASSIVFPLLNEGRAFGAITIYSRLTNAFSVEEIQLLKELSEDLSNGITTMRLRKAREKAEEALKESENRFNIIIKKSPVVFFFQDRNLHYKWIYNAHDNLIAESFAERTKQDIFSPEEAAFLIDAKKNVLMTGLGRQIEFKWKKGKDEYYHQIVLEPQRDNNGDLIGIYGLAFDITTQKKAEEVLKRDKETIENLVIEKSRELVNAQVQLEKSKRLSEIGTLASTVAHELRNPLAVILMASSNIKRKAKNELLDRHITNIEKKITECDQIINNLLYYSRLKDPSYEKIIIDSILDECIRNSKKQIRKKVTVKKKYGLNKNLEIDADPLQMKEVFSNIINNALDAVNEIEGKIEVRIIDNNDTVEIQIEDNGNGINENDLGKIFNPFFTTKAKGTGLGLSVCNHLVTMHGGSIFIESEVNKGTTVKINLQKEKKTDNG